MNIQTIRNNSTLIPNYSKINFIDMKRELSLTNWHHLLSVPCIDAMCSKFKDQLTACANKYIPQKPRRVESKKPLWMTNYLQKIITDKRKAYKRYKLTQNIADYEHYVDLKRECERKIKKQKREYETKISLDAKKNPKLFFNYIRSKKTVKSNIGPLTDNGKLVSDDKGMASVLNSTFSSVFTKENITPIPAPKIMYQGPDEQKLEIPETDMSEVLLYMREVDANKSPSPDGVSARVLKECSSELVLPITLIFSRSLAQAKVPVGWKRANVTPSFKKGDK